MLPKVQTRVRRQYINLRKSGARKLVEPYNSIPSKYIRIQERMNDTYQRVVPGGWVNRSKQEMADNIITHIRMAIDKGDYTYRYF